MKIMRNAQCSRYIQQCTYRSSSSKYAKKPLYGAGAVAVAIAYAIAIPGSCPRAYAASKQTNEAAPPYEVNSELL